MENNKVVKPRPPELPAVVSDWRRYIKTEPTINDHVEAIHIELLTNEEDNAKYKAYLYACWDEQAVEGSLSADNTLAAQMIREKAGPESPLSREKLATISKSLGVVLRRYHESRKERRQRVGEEVVPDNE
jgi:hypothetical protein